MLGFVLLQWWSKNLEGKDLLPRHSSVFRWALPDPFAQRTQLSPNWCFFWGVNLHVLGYICSQERLGCLQSKERCRRANTSCCLPSSPLPRAVLAQRGRTSACPWGLPACASSSLPSFWAALCPPGAGTSEWAPSQAQLLLMPPGIRACLPALISVLQNSKWCSADCTGR